MPKRKGAAGISGADDSVSLKSVRHMWLKISNEDPPNDKCVETGHFQPCTSADPSSVYFAVAVSCDYEDNHVVGLGPRPSLIAAYMCSRDLLLSI